MKTLGDNGEPSELDLAVSGVGHAEQQEEPSPPLTSAEPFPLLLLDGPDVVAAGVCFWCWSQARAFSDEGV